MRSTTHDETDGRLRELLREADPAAGDALTSEEVRALRRTTLAAGEPAQRRPWWLPAAGPALATAVLALLTAVAVWRALPLLPLPNLPEVILSAAKDLGGGEHGPTKEQVRKERAAERPSRGGGERATPPVENEGRAAAIAAAPPPQQSPRALRRAPTPSTLPQEARPLVQAQASLQALSSFPTQPVLGALESTRLTEPAPIAPEPIAAAADEPDMASASAEPEKAPGLQLQFSAPGGTRIIWTLTSPAAPAPSES